MNSMIRSPRVFLIVLSSLLLAGLAGAPARAEEETAPPAEKKVLRLTIRGEVFDGNPPFQLFGELGGVSLHELTGAIRKAGGDDTVAALVLRLKDPLLGWTQAQALRRELLELRRAGKPIHCHVDSAASIGYLLASAATEVSMTPTADLSIPGLGAQLIYFKGLLDKIGVRFEELRMGRYKSAAEPFTRSGPSDPVREEMQSILDELFEDFIAAIAENRSLKPLAVRALIDRAMLSAEEAKEAGLVDRLEYEDEFLARVQKRGDKTLKLADARLGRQLELEEFTGFAGMMKLFSELLGGGRGAAGSARPKVAVIFGVGPIITGGGTESLFGGSLITSEEMVKLFRKVREDDSVKAVVFRINSPGGSALASDLIWREVKITAAKKPVVVSMGDLAASGGYYVACPATAIFAENTTLTGSIGVIGMVPNLRGLFDHLGLTVESITRGKRAGMISPYGELTDDGRELLMKMMREIYADFIDHVAEGRKLPRAGVESVAEGRVWTGGQALRHGLVDRIGGLDDAIREARKLSGAPDDAELLHLPRAKTFFDLLQGGMEGDAALRAAARALPLEIRRVLRQAGWAADLGRERIFAVLPAAVSIK